MGETEVGAPVTTTDGDDAELGDDDGSADSSGNLLGGLDSETDVALGVADEDDGLEAGALTGTGLLLDGLDLMLRGSQLASSHVLTVRYICLVRVRTFMTSSLSLGRKKSTIWYSLMGSECR